MRPRLALSPAEPVALLVVGVWLIWAWQGGGFSPRWWGSLGVVMVFLVGLGYLLVPPAFASWCRPRAVAFAGLAAFVVWTALSISWASFPSESWNGADTTLLYALSFAAFASWRWSSETFTRVMALLALGIGVIGLVTLLQADLRPDHWRSFQDGRLLPPIGYVNANVVLWMTGFFSALWLVTKRTTHWFLRTLSMACASLLLDLALIGESRGWFYLLPLAFLLLVALVRQRLRSLLALTIVSTGTIVILQPLLRVYERASEKHPVGPPLSQATRDILVVAAAAAAVTALWALVDCRLVLPRTLHRAAVGAASVVAAGSLVTGGALAAMRIDHPIAHLHSAWHDFDRGYPTGESNGSRFTGSLGTDRAQEWTVAWREFTRHPIVGIGADNYAAAYLEQRQNDLYEPRYPHSTPLRLLSQLGIVGTLLFLVFLFPAVAGALRMRRSLPPELGSGVGIAILVTLYWLAEGSVDWFWEIPALAAPAFGLLGLALGVAEQPSPMSARRSRPLRIAGLAATGTVCAAAVVGLALPWLSTSYQDTAMAIWRQQPQLAYRRLATASRLNPLSAEPLLLEGSIQLRRGELAQAQRSLSRARQREPRNWYTYFQLALVASQRGEQRLALDAIARARELNPMDPIVRYAQLRIGRGEHVDANRLNHLYLNDLNRRLMGNPSFG